MGNFRSSDRVVAQRTVQTLTSTATGATTGQILDGVGFATVTAQATDADDCICLPSIAIGKELYIMAGVACELRAKVGEKSKSINATGVQNSSGVAVKELVLAANVLYRAVAISATAWLITKVHTAHIDNAASDVVGAGTPD
jgi:hypothetical protein